MVSLSLPSPLACCGECYLAKSFCKCLRFSLLPPLHFPCLFPFPCLVLWRDGGSPGELSRREAGEDSKFPSKISCGWSYSHGKRLWRCPVPARLQADALHPFCNGEESQFRAWCASSSVAFSQIPRWSAEKCAFFFFFSMILSAWVGFASQKLEARFQDA